MRLHIAAVLYIIIQAFLFGAGVVLASLLVDGSDAQVGALTNCALASLVLAVPLAWEAALLLMSHRERAQL